MNGTSSSTADDQQTKKFVKILCRGSNEDLVFKVKRTTPFKKLKDSYARQMGIPIRNELRFVFLGRNVFDNETPDSLEMDGEEEIDVVGPRIGGGSLLGPGSRC